MAASDPVRTDKPGGHLPARPAVIHDAGLESEVSTVQPSRCDGVFRAREDSR